jgi:hypothetical protein
MSLAVFGFLLAGALVALCWKSGRAVGVALCAGLLGLTLAGSNGALGEPARQLAASVRATVAAVSASMFGDTTAGRAGGDKPAGERRDRADRPAHKDDTKEREAR